MNLEQLIQELKKVVHFKDGTEPGDLVLILMENPQIIHYARIAAIERDTSKKDEWWHLSFHLLTIPPQKMTWTLRTAQFTGREIFTMSGQKRFIQAIRFEEPRPPEKKSEKKEVPQKSSLRLVK